MRDGVADTTSYYNNPDENLLPQGRADLRVSAIRSDTPFFRTGVWDGITLTPYIPIAKAGGIMVILDKIKTILENHYKGGIMKLINVSHFNVEIKSETGDYLILMPDKIFTILKSQN